MVDCTRNQNAGTSRSSTLHTTLLKVQIYTAEPIKIWRYKKDQKLLDGIHILYPPHLDLHLAEQWIDKCQTKHRQCQQLQHLPRPESLKVIDCEKNIIVPLPSGHEYIALSYVWGEALNACENTALESENLPRTISHSILMARKLRYRYLWIDRYVSLLY